VSDQFQTARDFRINFRTCLPTFLPLFAEIERSNSKLSGEGCRNMFKVAQEIQSGINYDSHQADIYK
jgi:hypothetical protein